MTNSGQQPEPQVDIDLTASPLESIPGPSGHGQDIEASLKLSVLDKLLRLGLRIVDKSGRMADCMIFMLSTVAASLPTLVVLLVCTVAHASTGWSVGLSLGTLAVFTTLAVSSLELGRRRPSIQLTPVQRNVERPVLQRTGKKNRKKNKSAKKRKGNGPKNRRW